MDIQTCLNLQLIVDKDESIELIEIWDKVLYIRRDKGRNTFYSKKGLTNLKSGIYVNPYKAAFKYKELQKKYHPDLHYNKKEYYVEISQSVNQWKDLLLKCNQRIFNGDVYRILIEFCGQDTSIFHSTVPAMLIAEYETPRLLNIPRFSCEQDFIEWKAKISGWSQQLTDMSLTRNQRIRKYGYDPIYEWHGLPRDTKDSDLPF